MYRRCSEHIYRTQNAMLMGEKKYLLLLAAELGGHDIDCAPVEYCEEENLRDKENYYIETYKPCLNINMPGCRQDITDLKIEELLANLRYKIA